MKKKLIAGTELLCSEIILGSDYYGESTDKNTASSFMDYYFEAGGNTIDTARLYTGGKSEEVIGEYLRERGLRDKVVVSTKCAHPPLGHMDVSRLSREEIESDIDKSLAALKTDYIDLLWLHRDDKSIEVGGIIETLNDMVKKGKIRYFGASNWCGDRLRQAELYAREHSLMGFCASQIQWSAAKPARNYDPTLVCMDCREYAYYTESRLPVFAFSAQAKGFFEKYDKACLSDKARDRFLCEENVEMYRRIKECTRDGYSISQVALSLLIKTEEFDCFPIINCSKLSQLYDSLDAVKVDKRFFKLF